MQNGKRGICTGNRGRDRAHSANFDIDTGEEKEEKSRCKSTAGGAGSSAKSESDKGAGRLFRLLTIPACALGALLV